MSTLDYPRPDLFAPATGSPSLGEITTGAEPGMGREGSGRSLPGCVRYMGRLYAENSVSLAGAKRARKINQKRKIMTKT